METPEIYRKKVLDIVSKSKSLCPMLWAHITVEPTSIQSFCCISMHKDNRKQSSLKDYWDGKEINIARKQMLNNDRPYQCKTCWEQEDAGVKSHRSNLTSMFKSDFDHLDVGYWKIMYDNLNSTLTDKKMQHQPMYYDIKFGNLCNLKCRMCGPGASSQINKEAKEYESLFNSDLYPNGPVDESKFLWIKEKDGWWKEFNNFTHDAYKFKFTGGEPLLNDQVIDFLNYMVKTDRSKDTMIHLITNGTKINEQLIKETLLKFKAVKLNVSVDGAYDHYEYIRYPGRWNKLTSNIQLLKDLSPNSMTEDYDYNRMTLSISPVLQFYNLFNIIDIYLYAESIPSLILERNFVMSPKYWAPNNLTDEMKKIVINYYNENKSRLKFEQHRKHIDNYITYLSNSTINDEKALYRFAKYTKTYDKIRGQNFKESCPLEYDLFKEYFE